MPWPRWGSRGTRERDPRPMARVGARRKGEGPAPRGAAVPRLAKPARHARYAPGVHRSIGGCRRSGEAASLRRAGQASHRGVGGAGVPRLSRRLSPAATCGARGSPSVPLSRPVPTRDVSRVGCLTLARSGARSFELAVRIVVAADHAGYPLKAAVVAELRASGHEVADLGTNDPSKPSDYPEAAERAAEAQFGGGAGRGGGRPGGPARAAGRGGQRPARQTGPARPADASVRGRSSTPKAGGFTAAAASADRAMRAGRVPRMPRWLRQPRHGSRAWYCPFTLASGSDPRHESRVALLVEDAGDRVLLAREAGVHVRPRIGGEQPRGERPDLREHLVPRATARRVGRVDPAIRHRDDGGQVEAEFRAQRLAGGPAGNGLVPGQGPPPGEPAGRAGGNA